jgi:hypothetical protein
MNNKNLPIKIFEKRQTTDERPTEGGGSDKPPKWVLDGQQLHSRSGTLLDEVNLAYQKIQSRFKKHSTVPNVLKAKVLGDALAKSHRADFAQFFTSNKVERILGFTENQELLIRIDSPSQLNELSKKLEQTEKNAKAISGIEAIEILEPSIEITQGMTPDNEKIVLRIQLINYNNFQINKQALEAFKALIAGTKHLELKKSVKYTEAMEIHRVVADSLEALEELYEFSAILSVEPMPIMEVVEDDFFIEETIQIPLPIDGVEYSIVGVLDSGISNILDPWIVGKRYTNYPKNYLNTAHGTFVSGLIGFGDMLEGQTYTGTHGCKFLDAAVYPNTKMEIIYEDDLIANIREAITKHGDQVKIWNMSLGMGYETKDSEFSKLGIALDAIQDEKEVLIIKSAGNCNNFTKGIANGRIAGGADSIRALTVGSIAQSQNSTDLVQENLLSPFSRVGPGPANIIKPELVHYGGNVGIVNQKLFENGVRSLTTDGKIKKSIGTSFSTPRITSIAADLNRKMKEEFDPLMLKALILHSAKYSKEIDLPINDKINQYGFGLPSNASDILYNDPYEITLIMRDTLSKGEFTEILDFPYPQSLIDSQGYYYGQISLTLVSHPIVESFQGPEYCQSNIEVKLGTYDQKTRRDISKRTIRYEMGRTGAENLLKANHYSKKKSHESKKIFANTEKMLVQYGDKFYPNKKYVIDLTELTTANKKFIQAPKGWYLKVEGLYRDFIEKNADIRRMGLSQEYCIVITIRDPLKKHQVYTDVTRLLQSNNFIHRDIQVEQRIDIRGDESTK